MEHDNIKELVADLQKTQEDRHEAAVEVFHKLQQDLSESKNALDKAQKDIRWLQSNSALLWVAVVLLVVF